jgi:hypothetical protein
VPKVQAHIPVMPREAARRVSAVLFFRIFRQPWRRASKPFPCKFYKVLADERPARSRGRTDPRDGVLRSPRDVGGRRSSTSPAASDRCPARRLLSLRPKSPGTSGALLCLFFPFTSSPSPANRVKISVTLVDN